MHLPLLFWILFALPFFPPVSLPTCLMCVREENEVAEIVPACVRECVWRVFNIAAQLPDSLFSVAAITHLCLCLSASACWYVRHAVWTPTQPLAMFVRKSGSCVTWCVNSPFIHSVLYCIHHCWYITFLRNCQNSVKPSLASSAHASRAQGVNTRTCSSNHHLFYL